MICWISSSWACWRYYRKRINATNKQPFHLMHDWHLLLDFPILVVGAFLDLHTFWFLQITNHGFDHFTDVFAQANVCRALYIVISGIFQQPSHNRAGNVYAQENSESDHKFNTTQCDNPNLEGLAACLNPPSWQKKQKQAWTKITDW